MVKFMRNTEYLIMLWWKLGKFIGGFFYYPIAWTFKGMLYGFILLGKVAILTVKPVGYCCRWMYEGIVSIYRLTKNRINR